MSSLIFSTPTRKELFRAPTPSEGHVGAVDIWTMAWQTWLQIAAASPKRGAASTAYVTTMLDALPLIYRCERFGKVILER